MGNCNCNCLYFLRRKSKFDRLISIAYPTDDDGPKIKKVHNNDKFFYYLPDLHEVDKKINAVSVKGALQEETKTELLDRLDLMKLKIDNWNYIDKSVFEESSAYIPPQDENLEKIAVINKPLLIIEIQQGVVIKPAAKQISKVICKVNITSAETEKSKQPLKKWELLSDTEDFSKPSWRKAFAYVFEDIQEFNNVQINFTLHYIPSNKKGSIQIGDSQSFSLISFWDQEIYNKEIHFKDAISKGTLASIVVRFQFVHDLQNLQNKKASEIEARIEKILSIRTSQSYSRSLTQAQRSLKPNNVETPHPSFDSKPTMEFDNKFYIYGQQQ